MMDLCSSADLLEFLQYKGVAVLALGTYGGAKGKTTKSVTGRNLLNYLKLTEDPTKTKTKIFFIDILSLFCRQS